jgi:hypothetical protein
LPFINLLQTVLLFDFHGLAAAYNGARAALGDNHFGAALGAAISLAYRISHNLSPLCVIYILFNYSHACQILSKMSYHFPFSSSQRKLGSSPY